MKAHETTTSRKVHELITSALEDLQITDVVYHDLARTQPLVEDLLSTLLNRAAPPARLLLLGSNALLAHSIVLAGYDLTFKRFGENILPEEVTRLIKGRVTREMLSADGLDDDELYDVIVLPFVFEHVDASPQRVLANVGKNLKRDGLIVTCTKNLGVLRTRVRSALGKSFLPMEAETSFDVSFGWPVQPSYRNYLASELLFSAVDAGFRPLEWKHSLSRTAVSNADFLSLKSYASLKVQHLAKRVIPSARDSIVLTLRRETANEARERGRSPEPRIESLGILKESSVPMVSVIVPTKNRAELLRNSFSGLVDQTYPSDRLEVIVVNDGSTDETDAAVRELAMVSPFQVRYFKTDGVGAIGARNLGMYSAAGDIVAHLDDDCRPCPEWIEEGVRGFATESVAIVGGPIMAKPEQQMGFFSLCDVYEDEYGVYPTPNVFYLKSVALKAGGFDESFGGNLRGRPVWGWDSDLGWRIRNAGYDSEFRHGALVYQEIFRRRPKEWLLDGWRANSLPAAVARVPELGRFRLFAGLFAAKGTFYFDLAVIGTALALFRNKRLGLALAFPWVVLFAPQVARNDVWPPQRWPKLAIKVSLLGIRQAVTLGGLLVGSAKARKVVL